MTLSSAPRKPGRAAAPSSPTPRTRKYGVSHDEARNVSALGMWDAAGTRVEKAVCLRHDPLGRMVLAAEMNPNYFYGGTTTWPPDSSLTRTIARYAYDGRGRRVARQDGATGSWTYLVSDASGNLLSELVLVNRFWARVRDYVWLDGRPLAQVEYPTATTSATYFLHLDHIGLPRAMTNATQQVVWSAAARPYGDITETTTPDPQTGKTVVTNLRLPGQYDERLLASVGLQGPYYNWNRWYLPSAGRYLELDPYALRGLIDETGEAQPPAPDWYTYGRQNPMRFTDPDGRNPLLLVCAAAAGAVLGWLLGDLAFSCSDRDSICREKKSGCYCMCAGKGWGPAPLGRVRDLYTCNQKCTSEYWDSHPDNVFGFCK